MARESSAPCFCLDGASLRRYARGAPDRESLLLTRNSTPMENAATAAIPTIGTTSVLPGEAGSGFLENVAVRVPPLSANAVVEGWPT